MVEIAGIIGSLRPFKALVLGDYFLDTYTIGKVRRISPEAPVAVVNANRTTHLPGGAGNVVLNLLALGGEVLAFGRIGEDSAGRILVSELEAAGAETCCLLTEEEYQTPIKNRIIADNQQIVRVDHEVVTPVGKGFEQMALDQLLSAIEQVNIVAISDYAKGMLSEVLLEAVISESKKRGIPIIADPKGIDFSRYYGVTIIKPNLSEAVAAAGLGADTPLEEIAEKVLQISGAEYLMVTRSEHGISVFQPENRRSDYPVRVREIKDVTGAGDTVLAMLTCALASGLPVSSAAHLCNIAAGIAIERFGCACVTLADIAQRALEYDIDGKVFDEEHLFALKHILEQQRFAVLGFETEQELTTEIFKEIRKLGSVKERDLLVYLRDPQPDEHFVDLISSLRDVKYIIIHGENLRRFCDMIPPEEVYIAKDNRIEILDHAEALL